MIACLIDWEKWSGLEFHHSIIAWIGQAILCTNLKPISWHPLTDRNTPRDIRPLPSRWSDIPTRASARHIRDLRTFQDQQWCARCSALLLKARTNAVQKSRLVVGPISQCDYTAAFEYMRPNHLVRSHFSWLRCCRCCWKHVPSWLKSAQVYYAGLGLTPGNIRANMKATFDKSIKPISTVDDAGNTGWGKCMVPQMIRLQVAEDDWKRGVTTIIVLIMSNTTSARSSPDWVYYWLRIVKRNLWTIKQLMESRIRKIDEKESILYRHKGSYSCCGAAFTMWRLWKSNVPPDTWKPEYRRHFQACWQPRQCSGVTLMPDSHPSLHLPPYHCRLPISLWYNP